MKFTERIYSSVLLLALILFLFSGCSSDIPDDRTNIAIPDASTQSHFTSPTVDNTTEAATDTVPQETVLPPTEIVPAITETVPAVTETVPTITSLTDLRDYMNEQVDMGTLEFSFVYAGNDKITAQLIAQILSCCYINCSWEGNLYHVTVTEYPGDRIVRAWQSGDYSGLTDTEVQVMEYAIDLVSEWKTYTSDPWELELLIHDFLSEHIFYVEGDLYFNDPNNVPRELTAVGALQDGLANCQGYTDAFYLLGNLAGLWVDRMHVEDSVGYHVLNTVNLNGLWYIVDVTYDDMDDESEYFHYLFNVGTDRVREYHWAPEMEYRPIADKTDDQFYYARNNILFQDEQSAANYVAQNWNGGNAFFRFMVQGTTNDQTMNTELYDALMELDVGFSYTYWYYVDGTDIYFNLTLNEY